MGSLGPLLVVAIVFGLIGRIASAAKRQQSASRTLGGSADGGASSQPMFGLLAEMRKEVELARRRQIAASRTTHPKLIEKSRRARPSAPPRPSRSPVVAVESIRPEREVIDYDLEAAGLVASRTAAAELTAEGRPAGAHKAFDARIREKSVPVAPRSHPLGRLRTAMIWREILGPPVSLRPPGE